MEKRKINPEEYQEWRIFAKLFDTIYENNFELAKTFIDGGKVDVSIGKSCGDTPLIAICRQMTIKTEDEAAKFINYLWQSDSKFKRSNNFVKTATKYAKSNGLTVQALEYLQWTILYDSLQDACLLWQNDQHCGRTLFIYGKENMS